MAAAGGEHTGAADSSSKGHIYFLVSFSDTGMISGYPLVMLLCSDAADRRRRRWSLHTPPRGVSCMHAPRRARSPLLRVKSDCMCRIGFIVFACISAHLSFRGAAKQNPIGGRAFSGRDRDQHNKSSTRGQQKSSQKMTSQTFKWRLFKNHSKM